jgi:CheY-like chemotaxis protein
MPERGIILLAEDREQDVEIIRRAFKQGGIRNPLFVARDGEETVAYLEGTGKFANRDEYPLPDLLLLDLKMPKLDGFEVLRWVRHQPGFSSLCIVVLTSSEDSRDVNRAYELGANSFLVKPSDFENVIEMTQLIRDWWLRTSRIPHSVRRGAETMKEPARPSLEPELGFIP